MVSATNTGVVNEIYAIIFNLSYNFDYIKYAIKFCVFDIILSCNCELRDTTTNEKTIIR